MQTSIKTTSIGGGFVFASLAQRQVSFDWANVGDAGNAADNSTGFGAVDYDYRISKHEVTVGQYAEFLNAVAAADTYNLYNRNMATNLNIVGISRSGSSGSYSYSVIGSADRPITFVSWFDAARFVNWMENGQGSGSTETGVYTLNGATDGIFFAKAGTKYWIPTEDEWYKAAYYDPTLGNVDDGDNYHLYATQSSVAPGNDLGSGINLANYRSDDFTATPGNNTYSSTTQYLTDVGAFSGSASYYGTFDQGGNVWELNDAFIFPSSRGLRGGCWGCVDLSLLSSNRNSIVATTKSAGVGFRIASVPEPGSVALVSLADPGML